MHESAKFWKKVTILHVFSSICLLRMFEHVEFLGINVFEL